MIAVVLALLASAAAGEAAPQGPEPLAQPQPAPLQPPPRPGAPAGPEQTPRPLAQDLEQENGPGTAPSSPLLDCYRAAQRRANRATQAPRAAPPATGTSAPAAPRQTGAPASARVPGAGDAYVCDLAVQMARDSGSAQTLAAALTNRAVVLAGEGRLEPALTDLESASQLTPDDPAIHGNRGNLLLRLGRPMEALAAHGRAVELAPQDPGTYYNRAFSYRAVGEPVRAGQDVAAARTLLERRMRFTVPGTREPGAPRSP